MTETITKSKSWTELEAYPNFKDELVKDGFEVKLDTNMRLLVCKKTERVSQYISLHSEGYKINFHKEDGKGEVIDFEYNHSVAANEDSLIQIKDLLKCA